MQNEEILPSCVKVRNAAFPCVFSQEYGATCARYGSTAALLLTLVFIINKQLSPVWKNPHGIYLYIAYYCNAAI